MADVPENAPERKLLIEFYIEKFNVKKKMFN
jgi:hypothetical protein